MVRLSLSGLTGPRRLPPMPPAVWSRCGSRNGRAVLAVVQARPRCSRADVARADRPVHLRRLHPGRRAGRRPASWSSSAPAAAAGGGRPSVSLGLAPRAGCLIGIHLGHADLRVVLTSLDGTVLHEQRHFLDVDHEPQRSLDQVGSQHRRPARGGRGRPTTGSSGSASRSRRPWSDSRAARLAADAARLGRGRHRRHPGRAHRTAGPPRQRRDPGRAGRVAPRRRRRQSTTSST